jgi:hypothetical protein
MSTRIHPISTRTLSSYWSSMKPGFPGLRVIELTGSSAVIATLPPVADGGLLAVLNLTGVACSIRPSSEAPLLARNAFLVSGANDVTLPKYSWLLLAALQSKTVWVPINLNTQVRP